MNTVTDSDFSKSVLDPLQKTHEWSNLYFWQNHDERKRSLLIVTEMVI